MLGVPKTSGGFGVKRFPPAQRLPVQAPMSSFLLPPPPPPSSSLPPPPPSVTSVQCSPAFPQDPRVIRWHRVGVGVLLGAGPTAPPACWEPALSYPTHGPRLQNSSPRVGGGTERKGEGSIIPLVGVGGMGHQGRLAGTGQSFWRERVSDSSPPRPHRLHAPQLCGEFCHHAACACESLCGMDVQVCLRESGECLGLQLCVTVSEHLLCLCVSACVMGM